MKRRLNYLLVLVLILSCSGLQAQQLQGLWKKTEQYYQGFELKRQQTLLARQDSLARLIKYKPQVQAQIQQGLSSLEGTTGAFIPLPGIINITGSGKPAGSSHTFNHFASGTLNWDLINFGKKGLEQDIAAKDIEYSQLDFQDYRIRMQERLAQRYVEYLYFGVMNEWFAKHAERYETIVQISQGLASAGMVPGADTLIASSALQQVQSNLLLIQGKMDGSKFLLEEFAGGSAMDAVEINFDQFLQVLSAQNVSANTHPSIQMLDKESETLQLKRSLSKKEKLPRFQLIGGLSNRGSGVTSDGLVDPGYGALYQDLANNYYVGLGLTWNLQDLFKSNVSQRKYDLLSKNKVISRDLLAQEIHSQVNNLQAQLHAANRGIQESDQSRVKAEQAYQLYKSRYEGGLINLTELLQVQEVLLQTERQNLSAYLDYWNLTINLSYQQADFTNLFNHL